MMHHSVNAVLKRRLASESKMEFEEIEALWDQFTCLASSEWPSDPNKIGWALDRRAFNYAFVPRYNGFVAAPNLIYDRIFQYYDSDNNGLIGFEEWIKGIDGMHTSDVRVKARIVFNGYDIDGDGYISRQDILRIFRAYYAIEKEATRNFVAELTEELSVRNSMDTVRSGQPLGSAFPPSSLPTPNAPHPSFAQKPHGTFDENSPVILDSDFEKATRKSIIEANELHQLEFDELSKRDAGDRLVPRCPLSRPPASDGADTRFQSLNRILGKKSCIRLRNRLSTSCSTLSFGQGKTWHWTLAVCARNVVNMPKPLTRCSRSSEAGANTMQRYSASASFGLSRLLLIPSVDR